MDFDLILRIMNVLLVPLLLYVVKIERRLTRLEVKCEIFLDGKEKL